MNRMRNPGDWQPFCSLRGVVRLILLVDWDPIGVFGSLDALNEYDSYASGVCKLLEAGATREKLIAHLDHIEKASMGLRGERIVLAEIADKLLVVYQIFLSSQ